MHIPLLRTHIYLLQVPNTSDTNHKTILADLPISVKGSYSIIPNNPMSNRQPQTTISSPSPIPLTSTQVRMLKENAESFGSKSIGSFGMPFLKSPRANKL